MAVSMTKQFLAASVVTFSALSAFAGRTEVPTIVTCEQGEGDQYVSVGIVKGTQGLQAIVVRHNVDDGSATIAANVNIREIAKGSSNAYFDDKETFGLFVNRNPSTGSATAKLIVVDNKGKSIDESGLDCYFSSTLKFD